MSSVGLYGISGSGIDVDSMVKVGMMSKQKEYDSMNQKYILKEWTKSAYLEVNNNVNSFNLSSLSQYKMSSNMNAKSAESSSSAVKVEANASAGIMPHKVSVESLSTNAYLIGRDSIPRINQDASSTSIALKDMLFKNLSYDDTTETYSIKFANANGSTVNRSNIKGSDKAIEFTLSDGKSEATISFTYDEVFKGATMNDFASRINSAGLNIKASYDTVNDRFSMYNAKGGEENTISITTAKNYDNDEGTRIYSGRIAANFLDALKLTQSKNGELVGDALSFGAPNTNASIAGENGKIRVDGVDYTTTDNKVTVAGITYTALDTTPTAATVTVSQDVDSIVEKVKSFVADYNKLLAGLYEKYDEKRDSNYKPLTQSQKDSMKEEQITKWEEKAKKGLLYHDQTIGKIINEMRSSITSPVENVEGKYNSVYSIGISTTGIKGQLVLNEDKLRKALSEDSDAVYNVFAKLDTTQKNAAGEVIDNPKGNGIAQRLGDIFGKATKSIKNIAGSSESITEDSELNTYLRQLQTKMSNFKKLMASFEDKLYKKYDAMESAFAKLNSQMSFIMGGNQ